MRRHALLATLLAALLAGVAAQDAATAAEERVPAASPEAELLTTCVSHTETLRGEIENLRATRATAIESLGAAQARADALTRAHEETTAATAAKDARIAELERAHASHVETSSAEKRRLKNEIASLEEQLLEREQSAPHTAAAHLSRAGEMTVTAVASAVDLAIARAANATRTAMRRVAAFEPPEAVAAALKKARPVATRGLRAAERAAAHAEKTFADAAAAVRREGARIDALAPHLTEENASLLVNATCGVAAALVVWAWSRRRGGAMSVPKSVARGSVPLRTPSPEKARRRVQSLRGARVISFDGL
jgi:chromosome segregation ATPase